MESLRHSLTLLVALSISLSTSIAHPRHDDRSPKHNHAPRQGAFAGMQMVSSPGGPNPTDLPSSDDIMPTSVITTSPIPALTIDMSVNPTDQSAANATTRTFPITVLQIPVATICPPNASIPLPIPYTPPPSNITTSLNRTNPSRPILDTTSCLTNATDYVPIPANVSRPSPTATLADPNARIILDSNGCQTLFSPVTTAICSTVVWMGGQVPLSVTDCGQWMTFSSSPVCGAAAATASPNGTAGETMAYFLAPWYDIASGAVPATVQVQTCSSAASSGGSGSCVTGSESWSVSTTTAQSAVVQTARFLGGAVGPLNLTLIPNHFTTSVPSTNGTTTSLSIDTTLTHLLPRTVPTIVRSRFNHDLRQDDSDQADSSQAAFGSSSVESTITTTTTIQLPAVTQTYHLEAATPQHTTITVTVQATITSVVHVSTLEAGVQTG